MNLMPDPLHRKPINGADAASAAPKPSEKKLKLSAGEAAQQENDPMGEYRFIFVRWPNGNWTIALDRDYMALEMEEF